MEPVDQVEDVIVGEPRRIEELREHQRQQDRHRAHHLARGQRRHPLQSLDPAAPAARLGAGLVPVPDPRQHDDGEEGRQREPGDAALAARDDEKCRQQRPQRRADIAADLEERLRQTVLAARGHAGDAR